MLLTSAAANKLLKEYQDKLDDAIRESEQKCVYEVDKDEVDPEIPEYSFRDSYIAIMKCENAIAKIKHAINVHNTTTELAVDGLGRFTIDELLVKLAQFNKDKLRLDRMRSRLQKERVSNTWGSKSGAITYRVANYNIDDAKQEYDAVSKLITNIQLALDMSNNTDTFEIDI